MIVNMQIDNECIVNKAGRFESAQLPDTAQFLALSHVNCDLWGI